LVGQELIQNVPDLFDLTTDDLLSLEGFSEKKARNLHAAIQNSKHPRLDRFLYGLGIRHVGRHMARVLARRFGSLAKLLQADEHELLEVPGVGPEIAHSTVRFFRTPHTQSALKHLHNSGLRIQNMPDNGGARPLADQTFVFTGSLDHFTRDEAKDRVELLGGRAVSSVSSDTDYVVVGKNPGSKLQEAKRRGTAIVNEHDFETMLQRDNG
jgi:DNA ligase (NAD+)